MPTLRSYKDLHVWQASMERVDVCCEIVGPIPHPYRFTFCDQLLRASISIPSNIAEGHCRSTKGYLNHLTYALGSQSELETILEIIKRRELAPSALTTTALSRSEEVGKMLHGLVVALERRLTPSP